MRVPADSGVTPDMLMAAAQRREERPDERIEPPPRERRTAPEGRGAAPVTPAAPDPRKERKR